MGLTKNEKEKKEQHVQTQIARYELFYEAGKKMTEAENTALAEWESTLDPNGELAKEDWPGWDAVIARITN